MALALIRRADETNRSAEGQTMDEQKRYMLIACAVTYRECYHCAAISKNIVNVRILDKGLHDIGEEKMSALLQKEIDSVDAERYDAILLGYGLCNNGIRGLHASLPLVIARAHDCITLLMGSKEVYRKYFDENPGTYFKSTGWMERGTSSEEYGESISVQLGIKGYDYYVQKYGEDNAKYIIETLGAGIENYSKFAFIDTQVCETARYRAQVKSDADEKGWEYEELCGSTAILLKMMNGEWDEDVFLVLDPGKAIEPSHRDDIIKSVEEDGSDPLVS